MSQQLDNGEKNDGITVINTKWLMISSAIFLGILGIITSFFSEKFLTFYGVSPSKTINILMIKIIGAHYLAFAILNWMGKENIIGGIYSRPVAVGNFTHFLFITVTLLKLLINKQPTTFIVGAVLYAIFTIGFGYILFAGNKSCG